MFVSAALVAVVAVYLVITRLFPKLISAFLVYRYNIVISLGKIGLHPLCVYNLRLARGRFSLTADWLSLTSSLFNSQVNRPLSLQLRGVCVEYAAAAAAAGYDHQQSTTADASSSWRTDDPVPPSCSLASRRLLTIGQFTGLYVHAARAVWHRHASPSLDRRSGDSGDGGCVRVSVDRLTVEGTNTIRNELTLVLQADACCGQLGFTSMSTHPSGGVPYASSAGVVEDSAGVAAAGTADNVALARWSSDLELHATVVENGSEQNVADVSVEVTRPHIMISDLLLANCITRWLHKPRPRSAADQSALGWAELMPRSSVVSFSDLVVVVECGRVSSAPAPLQREITARLGSCRLDTRYSHQLRDTSCSAKLEELRVDSNACRLASLTNLQLSLRAGFLLSQYPTLEVALGVHTVQVSYYHSLVADWLATFNLTPPPSFTDQSVPAVADMPSADWRLSLDAECWDIDTYVELPNFKPLHTCLTHGKASGERGGAYELVLETVTVAQADSEPCTRRHVPGVLLLIGALVVRKCLATYDERGDHAPTALAENNATITATVSVLLDNAQVELSASACELLCFMADTASTVRLVLSHRRASSVSHTVHMNRPLSQWTLQTSNVGVFCATASGRIALCVDSWCVRRDTDTAPVTSLIDHVLLSTSAGQVAAPEAVLRCSRIKLRVPPNTATAAATNTGAGEMRTFVCSLRDTVDIAWTPACHMQLLVCARALLEWRRMLCRAWRRLTQASSATDSDNDSVGIGDTPSVPPTPRKVSFKCRDRAVVSWRLSAQYRLTFVLPDLLVTHTRFAACSAASGDTAATTLCIRCSQPRVSLNEHQVALVDGLLVQLTPRDDGVAEKRRSLPELQLKENRCLLVSLDSVSLTAPYECRLTTALHEHTVNTMRWLKQVHGVKKQPFTELSPLPPDLCIKIGQLRAEICDSAFEVKLRDNYELLVDEYHEGVKRFHTLDQKVEQLRRSHGLLQMRKVENLYGELRRRGAELYVSRSRRMYDQQPARTHLLLLSCAGVELTALVDTGTHGTARCVAAMRRHDPLSPWPDDSPKFSTLWSRETVFSCASLSVNLRDYPQKLLSVSHLLVWGQLIGAEMEAQARSIRQAVVHVGHPFEDAVVDRSVGGLKFYYDLSADVQHWVLAYGPCWEPAMALVHLCAERVLSPLSHDPSPPLPAWDKLRLKLHGRATLAAQQMTWLLHASLDPYNTTEEMEITCSELVIDSTDARLVLKGDMSVYVRTASKYDDCRLLNVPGVKVCAKLDWQCMGDCRDHHAVVPCAPDKLPEYSSNQEHDSFRAYRSQSVDLSVSIETHWKRTGRSSHTSQSLDAGVPTVLLYGSTLRWFENLQFILSGVTRPVYRGAVFNNVRPRKKQLSRHYRHVRLSLNVHACQVSYWMSFTRQHGIDARCGRVSLSSEHKLSVQRRRHGVANNTAAGTTGSGAGEDADGLLRRSSCAWTVHYVNCELNEAEIWLQCGVRGERGVCSLAVEKWFFLSVARVSYGRAPFVVALSQTDATASTASHSSTTHRLVVHNMRAAWTSSNRDTALSLFDTFISNQQLKKNLSTEALHGLNLMTDAAGASNSARRPAVPLKTPVKSPAGSEGLAATAMSPDVSQALGFAAAGATPSPISRLQSGQVASMLQKLIAEAENNQAPVAFSEDINQGDMTQQRLRGMSVCSGSDVTHHNWLIELVNSQVLLKGIDTPGYVIITASKAHVLQRAHRPVWRDCTLVSKTSWVGGLEGMQYYATVSAGGENDSLSENILWLTLDNIEGKTEHDIRDMPDMVGSGQSVGGVVSETVGACAEGTGAASIQLQRVVSRCRCEFFYASYGDTSVDPSLVRQIPPLPCYPAAAGAAAATECPWLLGVAASPASSDGAHGGLSGAPASGISGGVCGGDWWHDSEPVDALTVVHHDLEVCTNSLQYSMVLDVVNNLLLYVAPHKKQTSDRLQGLRFKMQLSTVEDQRRPIQSLQNRIRQLISEIRQLERSIYLLQKQLDEPGLERAAILRLQVEMADKEASTALKKEMLSIQAQDLATMIHVYKETQLTKSQKPATRHEETVALPVRTHEVCIRHAKWRLTEPDGQLGIADLVLSNFQYSKTVKSDDSVEHLIELGYISMVNALPNQAYREVLQPADIQSSMPVERQRSLRVFLRERPPVGGIRVKEHLEINVTPINIGMTYQFFKTILKFCFPERDTEDLDEEDTPPGESVKERAMGKRERRLKRRGSSFYVPIVRDDVQKMKERAENNMLFIYIKVPEVTVRVSYKGEKVKNLEDVHNFLLTVPTIEYHNVTWTWLDLLLAMKNDTKRVLLSQAIKQKLQIGGRGVSSDSLAVDEETKTRLLLGHTVSLAGGASRHHRRRRNDGSGGGGGDKNTASRLLHPRG